MTSTTLRVLAQALGLTEILLSHDVSSQTVEVILLLGTSSLLTLLAVAAAGRHSRKAEKGSD